jgi:hypothetical protein
MNNENQIKLISAEYFNTQTPASIIFTTKDTLVGTLTVLDPITFDGNVEESAAIFLEYIYNNFKMSSSLIFTNNDVTVGTLTLSDPITFDGNVDEHAKVFFEYVCNNFKIDDKK